MAVLTAADAASSPAAPHAALSLPQADDSPPMSRERGLTTEAPLNTQAVAGAGAQHVWLQVDDADAWTLATVTDRSGSDVQLTRLHAPPGVDKKLVISEEAFSKLSLATGELAVPGDDLVALEDVSDATMLHTLRLRYARDDIFTAIGPVLIVVNPYKPVRVCSGETFASLNELEEDDLPPHVFRIATAAFAGMVRTRKAQSILISGESGAGKTETTKMAMACLAEISGSSGAMTEKCLESGIVLEAFGNAKTVYNNNSSRFGKWCAVHFDRKNHMAACRVKSYLLEKSRVVGPSDGGRPRNSAQFGAIL